MTATLRLQRVLAPPPALELLGVGVRFGGVVAVNDVSLVFESGAIFGLIGPNGAGKTTVFDAITGLVRATGSVALFGQPIAELPPWERAKLGLGRSFQDARLFPGLTVRETLAVALERHLIRLGPFEAATRLPFARRVERRIAGEVDALIELMGLGRFRNRFVSELSTGTRRIVDLAACIAHHPRLLLLDEPSSGIAQRETEELGPVILRIRELLGCTILLIEHDMPLIGSVADELIALETGQVIARGLPEVVLHDPKVVEAYLGTEEDVIMRSGER